MRRRGFIAALSALSMSALVRADGTLAERLRQASHGGDFVVPGAAELDTAESLFLRLMGGDPAGNEHWNAIDLQVESLSGGTAVSELPARRTGRGFYLVRPTGAPVMVQAPHSFKDKHTREIALALVDSGRFRAAAWNTVPRHYERGGERVDADLAHLPSSHFIAFSLAFARAFPAGRIVQLHGFEQSKRRSSAGREADVILSAGRSPAPAHLLRLEQCLERSLGVRALVYPRDVRELGATTNSIGKALARVGFDGFVHVEFSLPLRERLAADRSSTDALRACLESLT